MVGRAALLLATLASLVTPGRTRASPVRLVDDVGTTVMVDANPGRIVSLSPGATEILFALGAGNRLVGTCSFCDWPAAARACAKVGDFAHPSLEAILAARPDLIVATGGPQRELVFKLRTGRVPVLVLYPATLEAVFANITTLGRAVHRERQAATLASRLRGRIATLTAGIADLPAFARPVVYFEVWADPLMAIGDTSYAGELIRLAGGVNVSRGAAGEYPRLSAETVLAANPGVIILSHCDDPAGPAAAVARRPGWANLAAVKAGRVYADLNMDLIVRPGPRLADGLDQLIRRFHPTAVK